jgi:hypothetical protein
MPPSATPLEKQNKVLKLIARGLKEASPGTQREELAREVERALKGIGAMPQHLKPKRQSPADFAIAVTEDEEALYENLYPLLPANPEEWTLEQILNA